MSNDIFCAENFTWLFVFAVGTFGTAFGVLVANGMTVKRAHNRVRLWSEVLANQHLTSLAFFPALIVAFKKQLSDMYEWACFALIFMSVTFFVLGMFNIKEHERYLAGDHPCSGREDCAAVLQPQTRREIGRLNLILALVSAIGSIVLIFCLQLGKEATSVPEGPPARQTGPPPAAALVSTPPLC